MMSSRRTDLTAFGVGPDKEQALTARMEALGIREADIVEKFIRSGGHGGQNVNKVATCVYLKHLPTGFEVKCQQERLQSLNRFLARRILVDKIETAILGKRSEEEQRIAKIRRQKRKRSKRAKDKMLAEKRLVSEKKRARSFKPDLSGD
jgi:protein subunit release factor B